MQTPKFCAPSVWPAQYREAILEKLREAYEFYPEMERFLTYMINNQPNILNYSKMRKYSRDLENRYTKPVSLKSMIREHLGMKLEGMDIVHERIQ